MTCRVKREPEDSGEVFPVCPTCGLRSLEKQWEEVEAAPPEVREQDLPKDERPAEAEPRTQQPFTRRVKARRETAIEVLRFLVTDFEGALVGDETAYALFHIFNPFLRGIVNQMVIMQCHWREAVRELEQFDKSFCLRYAKQLEEFKAWAEDPGESVPTFIEPETNTPHGQPFKETTS